MSREIKFRIYDEVLGMCEVQDISFCGGFCQVVKGDATYELNLDRLEQYTGLKDKNGREIYEGDILQLGDDTRVYWIVEEDRRDDLPRGFTMMATHPQHIHPHVTDTHIVGNIHENPDLLKHE